jgi:flavin-dependent dehydrogenase
MALPLLDSHFLLSCTYLISCESNAHRLRGRRKTNGGTRYNAGLISRLGNGQIGAGDRMVKKRESDKPYDVAIVGGGPAGSSAALTLAHLGANVVLFEAKSYPHDKLCGEFLSPECGESLAELGLSGLLRELNPAKIQYVRLTAPRGAIWETQLASPGWGLSREAFDASLAQRARSAGVQVRDGTRINKVLGNLRDGFELEAGTQSGRLIVQARTVISAHGKRANIDRVLGRSFFGRSQPFMAIKAHFKGPALPERVELHAFPGGYCGISEIDKGFQNVCLLIHQSTFKQARFSGRDHPDGLVKWMQGENKYLQEWFSKAERIQESWISIAQIPFERKRLVVNDILMAGDAAGLIVPLAGDGIAMALDGGILAAKSIAAYLEGRLSEVELKDQYRRAWNGRFAGRLRLGLALQALIMRPRWLRYGLGLLNSVPALGRFLVTHTRGVDRFEEYSV